MTPIAMEQITSMAQLLTLFAAIKRGRFATIYGAKPIALYKNEGGARGKAAVPVAADFRPVDTFHVTFHVGADYERAMSAALGVDYQKGINTNVETLISGMLMRYRSTGNICAIYLKGNRTFDGVMLDGKPLDAAQTAYLAKCRKPSPVGNGNPVEYRTLSLSNVTKMVVDGKAYTFDLAAINASAASAAV